MKRKPLACLLLLIGVNAYAAQDVTTLENLSSELVEIRQEIESLHSEINRNKALYDDEVRALSSQKTDLEVRVGRQQLNIKELSGQLSDLQSQTSEQSESAEALVPTLNQAITELRATIKADLPFKQTERLLALEEIESRLHTQVISPNKAANQLWAFVEDELMLGKSSGLYNDVVVTDGQERLVKVLRLGKLASFYRANDGEYGVIRHGAEGWTNEALTQSSDQRLLDDLFESFNRNIREGVFTVPNFLPEGDQS